MKGKSEVVEFHAGVVQETQALTFLEKIKLVACMHASEFSRRSLNQKGVDDALSSLEVFEPFAVPK